MPFEKIRLGLFDGWQDGMKKRGLVALLLFFFLFIATPVFCQEKAIRLKDGTLIFGKILSKENNSYFIETKSFGSIRVNGSDVLTIEDAATDKPVSQKDVYQQKILSNPDMMTAIQEISRDQEVIDMFSDPVLKDAIMRQDMEYLKKDPRFIKFMQSPTLQKIVQSVTERAPEKADQ